MSLSDHKGGMPLQGLRITSSKIRLWGKDTFYGNCLHVTDCLSATNQMLLDVYYSFN